MGRFTNLDFDERKPDRSLAEAQDPWPNQDGESCLKRADNHFYRGEYEPALTAYSRALRFDKNLVPAWAGQVRCLLHIGEVPEALTWSNRALEKFPNTPDLLALRGLAFVLDHDPRQGQEFLDGAIEQKNPTYWTWITRAEGLLAMGKPLENVERCFLKAQELDPENPNVWLQCGALWNHYHQPARARPMLLKAVHQDETNPLTNFECGLAYEKLGDKAMATGYFERAMALRPNYWSAVEARDRVRKCGLLGLWRK